MGAGFHIGPLAVCGGEAGLPCTAEGVRVEAIGGPSGVSGAWLDHVGEAEYRRCRTCCPALLINEETPCL